MDGMTLDSPLFEVSRTPCPCTTKDLRLTDSGIRSRGMTVKGLKDYIIGQGASQMQMQLEWDGIWATNKKVIDPVAPRYWAINEDDVYVLFRTQCYRMGD